MEFFFYSPLIWFHYETTFGSVLLIRLSLHGYHLLPLTKGLNHSGQKRVNNRNVFIYWLYLMPGFLVYLNFYGQILTEVYKLNTIEAKKNETEISEELSQLSCHVHIFLLVPLNSCLRSYVERKGGGGISFHGDSEVCWLSKPGLRTRVWFDSWITS